MPLPLKMVHPETQATGYVVGFEGVCKDFGAGKK